MIFESRFGGTAFVDLKFTTPMDRDRFACRCESLKVGQELAVALADNAELRGFQWRVVGIDPIRDAVELDLIA